MVTNMKGIYFHIGAILEVLESKAMSKSGLEAMNAVASVNFLKSDMTSGCVREVDGRMSTPESMTFEEASTS